MYFAAVTLCFFLKTDSPAPMDEDKADPKPLDPSHQVDGTADDDDEKHDEEKGAEATEQGDKKGLCNKQNRNERNCLANHFFHYCSECEM